MAAPITNYISVGSSSGFSSNVNRTVNSDGSTIDWYIAAFQLNNNISFLNTLQFDDVYVLMVGGGGGGGGGTNISEAAAGQGGGGSGHMLIRFINGVGANFPVAASYDINIGLGGNGGIGTASAGNGGHTLFGANRFGASSPDVSGGGGGTSAFPPRSNNFGLISNTGSSVGFEVLNNQNQGDGGIGGDATGPNTSQPIEGSTGGDAVPVNQDWGNPGGKGEYYLGPPFGLFGRLNAGGGGGGGGGFYDPSASVSLYLGQGGNQGSSGIGGFPGNWTDVSQSSDYVNGKSASTSLSLSSGTNSQFGAGGGGAGQPNTALGSSSNSATGGNGAAGIIIIWFSVITPVSISTPFYTLKYATSSVQSVSGERVYVDGSKDIHFTSVMLNGVGNSITFEPSAVGLSAELLLVAGGGGGGGGMNQQYTFTGQGGGGGGSIFGYGIVGTHFPVGVPIEIELGSGGFSGGGANPGGPGEDSYIDRYGSNPTHVTGGKGGSSLNSSSSDNGAGGTLVSAGRIIQTAGGTGGNGGQGGVGSTSSPTDFTVASGTPGSGSSAGNTGFQGLYEFPTYGAIAIGGGGGGGGGVRPSLTKVNDASGGGGAQGFGSGGAGGTAPFIGNWDNTSSFNGQNANGVVSLKYAQAGNGGGGGGVPYTPSNERIAASAGEGGQGLFAIHMSYSEPAPTPPSPPSIGYKNEYFAYEYDSSSLYVQVLSTGQKTKCVCGQVRPGIEYISIAETNNRLRFFPEAIGLSAEFILIGAGGQGGGGINSAVKRAGQGGGGGGLAYASATIGGEVLADISYDIILGYNLNTGGLGTSSGSDGSGSSFGSNIWNPYMEVIGASGGGVTVAQGNGGSVISFGPLVGGIGGNGGNGGTQDSSGNGVNGGNAALTPSGLPGKYIYPAYGQIIGSGGGGGGAGLPGIDNSGSGGIGGRGSGGVGGILLSLPFDGSNSETEVGIGVSIGGGGGGGAGIPAITEAVSQGGSPGNGLFAMILREAEVCNPVDPICGCLKRKKTLCPDPIDYKNIVTGGNDPRFNPAIAYALYVRGSLGRSGYQKSNYGNNQLNAFGSYPGAPGGSRAPPRNSFN